MDRNSPENYSEQTNMSLEATEHFVKDVLDLKCDLVKPIITPRQGGTFFSGGYFRGFSSSSSCFP